MEDFTRCMEFNDNAKVNELCVCAGSRLTIRRRIDFTRHVEHCPYRHLIEKRREEFFEQVRQSRL